MLPFCSDETLAKLEENILKMPPLSDSSDVMTAKKISELLLEGIGIGDYDDLVSKVCRRNENSDPRAVSYIRLIV